MDGYHKLDTGNHCEIWAEPTIPRSLRNAEESDIARVQTILKHIMCNGHEGLPENGFELEGRFPSGVAGIQKQAVYVVKAYNVRVYGGYVGNKPRRFVCVEGAIKKQNKADLKQLKRVAKALGVLNDEYG